MTTSAKAAEFSGGPVNYYKVEITNPTSLPGPYTAECNDIIEALGMTFAEGENFKALWRMAAARTLSSAKKGDDELYNCEKCAFFGARLLSQAKAKRSSKSFSEALSAIKHAADNA